MDSRIKNVLKYFKTTFHNSADLVIREFKISGTSCAILVMENMVDKQVIAQCVLNPILNAEINQKLPKNKFYYIYNNTLASVDQSLVDNYDSALEKLMSGFALFYMDFCNECIAFGVQGYETRGVSEPQNEIMQRGSREGFVESLNVNISMLRRRFKTPNLVFEKHKIGSVSNTQICFCYLDGAVSKKILNDLRNTIGKINIKSVLDSGFISSQLSKNHSKYIFSGTGYSERPDTVCAKISEGRIGILIDGTPSVIIIPYLFMENFQSFDDYSNRSFYATFVRWLKIFSFFLAMFLPGIFVALTTFHPELLPNSLLLKLMQSESQTPFPIGIEVFMLMILYEIMREAGLRVPKTLSQAVSIVGALVIGDAAVSSGFVGATTLMIVALTAISSYVTPALYEQTAVIRLIIIILAWFLSFWGVMLSAFVIISNICSEMIYDIPFSAPVSPLSFRQLKDVLIRSPWRILSKDNFLIQDLPGAKVKNKNE